MIRLNPQNFQFDVPKLNPLTEAYLEYWKEQKRRSIEGFWSDGYFMPAKLYFYSNFATIQNQKKFAKGKSFARPNLRDIEWMALRGVTAARGFSGFSHSEFTSLDIVNEALDKEDPMFLEIMKETYPEALDSEGKVKPFLDRVSHLELKIDTQEDEINRPIFKNNATNFLLCGSREYGKSMLMGAGTVLHEYLFDGVDAGANGTDGVAIYDVEKIKTATSTVVVGAAQSKYSTAVLDKFESSFDFLPGEVTIAGKAYPCPLRKGYKGSLKLGDKIEQAVKKKIGGTWKYVGTGSKVYHVSYNSDPYAAQGLRSNIMLFEEAGHFDNLEATWLNCVRNLSVGDEKFGTAIFIGTSGALEAGSLTLQDMFYNAPKYDLLTYNDTWEHRGKLGGLFIPTQMRAMTSKDEWGYTKWDFATNVEERERNKLKIAKNSSLALAKHIQYNPMTPSEMFLTKGNSIFPSIELQNRLREVESQELYEKLAKKVSLYFDNNSEYNGVNYRLDLTNSLKDISAYPLKDSEKDNLEGCIVIYEFPQLIDGRTPNDAYIIGHDPFASDSATGDSLGTIFVLKSRKYFSKIGHNEIVAVYRGRPYQGRDVVNEHLLKLSMFYGNAKVYFENAVGNVKSYFEKVKKLNLLAKAPRTVLTKKASYNINDPIIYGYPMSNQVIKREAINYLREWLLEEHSSQIDPNTGELTSITRNLDLIVDKRLLQQLIAFDWNVNADDVMGFAGCIIGLNETQNQYADKFNLTKEDPIKSQISALITNNKRLFNPRGGYNTTQAFFRR